MCVKCIILFHEKCFRFHYSCNAFYKFPDILYHTTNGDHIINSVFKVPPDIIATSLYNKVIKQATNLINEAFLNVLPYNPKIIHEEGEESCMFIYQDSLWIFKEPLQFYKKEIIFEAKLLGFVMLNNCLVIIKELPEKNNIEALFARAYLTKTEIAICKLNPPI